MITQQRLHELVTYDLDAGTFTWLVDRGYKAKAGSIAGCYCKDGYVRIRLDDKLYTGHRMAWLYLYGELLDKPFEIDHIDNNRSNNAKNNLRKVDRSQNNCNITHKKNNKLGLKNISVATTKNVGYEKLYYTYSVEVKLKGIRKRKVFPYNDEGLQQAIKWRDKTLNELHGEYSRT